MKVWIDGKSYEEGEDYSAERIDPVERARQRLTPFPEQKVIMVSTWPGPVVPNA